MSPLKRVTPTTLSKALASTAYMCFFVKRHLDYKPFVPPTYKVAREAEAIKEREKEREKQQSRMREVEDALLNII